MRTTSSLVALFLIVCHFLSFSMTLASPVAALEVLLRREMCYNGFCRVVEAPAVVDPFQLSSSPSSTPVADPELGAVVASSSESASAPESTPTSTTTTGSSEPSSSSSKTPNAGVALVSQPKLFCAVFAALSATVLVF
ncbi:hypothetical protein BC827DRAFT_1218570 [Russula dissimulans]|nr:hypothetical protein BC827DRAFT_1218570 [Russula dissimulans]